MLLIFFGLPGAGKTYAARAVCREFGITLHDGDADLPDMMRAAIAASQPVTEAMRDEFFMRLISTVLRLKSEKPDLAVAQTFLKERHRRWTLTILPEAHFILVEADEAIRERRLVNRTSGTHLDAEYARQMATLFEPPDIPHDHLFNNAAGDAHIIAQAKALLSTYRQA